MSEKMPESYLELPDGTRHEGRLQLDADGRPVVVMATCGTCGFSWNDALITALTPTPAGRCPNEYGHGDHCEACGASDDGTQTYCEQCGDALVDPKYIPDDVRPPEQLTVTGDAEPLTWDGEPLYAPDTVREGLFEPEAFEQLAGQTALDTDAPDNSAEAVEARRAMFQGFGWSTTL